MSVKIVTNSHWQVQGQDLYQMSVARLLLIVIYLLTDNIDIKAIFEDAYQDSVLQVVRNRKHT